MRPGSLEIVANTWCAQQIKRKRICNWGILHKGDREERDDFIPLLFCFAVSLPCLLACREGLLLRRWARRLHVPTAAFRRRRQRHRSCVCSRSWPRRPWPCTYGLAYDVVKHENAWDVPAVVDCSSQGDRHAAGHHVPSCSCRPITGNSKRERWRERRGSCPCGAPAKWSALPVSSAARSSFIGIAFVARRITWRVISASSWRVGSSSRVSFTAGEGSGLRHLLVSMHAGISISAGRILRWCLVATLLGPGGGSKGRLRGTREARLVRSVCDSESTMRRKSPIWVVRRSSMGDRGER